MSTLDTIFNDISGWLVGSVSASLIFTVVLTILSFTILMAIAKRYIVQALLLINAWLPSVVLSFVTDFSLVPNKVIDPQGISLLLFPYTWDLCFAIDSLRMMSGIMIILSYASLVHLGIMFCHYKQCNKLWSLLIGYALLLGLGLGMVNFHTVLVSSYVSACISSGMPPLFLPMILVVFIIFFVFYTQVLRKKK